MCDLRLLGIASQLAFFGHVFEDGLMEPINVRLDVWPHDLGPGGWVVPVDNHLSHWKVTRIYAVYEAPDGIKRGPDPWGKPIRPHMLRAYLVDLDGSQGLDLPDYQRVLLHRIPRRPDWWIKTVDDDYLARIEQHRVEPGER